jgi:hypothetical protein
MIKRDLIMLKLFMIAACLGHIVCGVTDCMMAYSKSGRFDFSDSKDSEKMKQVFSEMPLRQIELATLVGIFALFAAAPGYLSLSMWIAQYSKTAGNICFIASLFFIVLIVTHHGFCGAVEWFFIRFGRTDEALTAIMEFFKKTIIMAVAYVGLLVFAIVFFILVVAGKTGLPRWAAVFNTFPIFLVLAPTRIPAKGNIANAIMFLGMSFLL